ncbi:MAG: DegT/DnrJ/EryC1/StrS family aminotransferase [Thermaerobacterales bacterium]
MTVELDAIPPEALTAEKRRTAEELVPGQFHRFFSLGRGALSWLIRAYNLTAGDEVLLPSYGCFSIVDPFTEAGLRPVFYRVDEGLRVDLADIARRRTPATKMILIVHYFGFPQPDEVMKFLAAEDSLITIEDCTHGPFSTWQGRTVGHFGQVAFTSFRKCIPVPDGAALAFKEPPPSDPPLEPSVAYGIHARCRYWVMRSGGRRRARARERRASAALRTWMMQKIRRARDGAVRQAPMTAVSRHLLERVPVEAGLERRRLNYELAAELCASLQGIKLLFPDLPAGVSPMLVPVRIKGGRRDEVRRALKAAGILAPVHWPPLPEIGSAFPETHRLAAEILSLPCDERYIETDMKRLGAVVEGVLGSRLPA